MKEDTKVIIKRINDWLEVYQNKNDGYYNATALLKQYNEHYPNERKEMYDFFRTKNTQKYIGSVISDGESSKDNCPSVCKNTKKSKVRIITFVENQLNKTPIDNSCDGKAQPNIFGMVENQDNSFPKIFGKIDNEKDTLFYVKKGRKSKVGRSAEIYYFAPMLFSKFGTWLSPELERDIHKVLWNNVLEYRNELRRINPKLHDSIATIAGDDNNIYIKVHSMLNKAVFGRFEREGKQIDSGSENQLNMMKDIESEIIVLIKHNIITDYEQLKTHIQRYYL